MRESRDIKHKWDFQKWENNIIKMKNSMDGINNSIDMKDNFTEFKNKPIETIRTEGKGFKRIEKKT